MHRSKEKSLSHERTAYANQPPATKFQRSTPLYIPVLLEFQFGKLDGAKTLGIRPVNRGMGVCV